MSRIHRRDLLRSSAATVIGASMSQHLCAQSSPRRTIVAAVQYAPVLGDVDSNLHRAESLVREAAAQGAKWVVLPEFFTSGLAMHPVMFAAWRPIDGEPTSFLVRIAKELRIHLGGSFLASSGGDVFNTFVLAAPNGMTLTHDKDFPSTVYESSFCAGGEDRAYVEKIRKDGFKTSDTLIRSRIENNVDGVLRTSDHAVGVALCWELVRYRTTRRLRGNIDLLLGASAWWWSTPEFEWPGNTNNDSAQGRKKQLNLIQEAPRRQARMLGVPVVHSNFVGINPSLLSHDFGQPATGRYLGQSQIVDGNGRPLKLLGEKEEGIVIAEVELGRVPPQEQVPSDEFWMPEVDASVRLEWSSTGAMGRDYYLTETRRRILDVTKP
jgi:predicted amidohydrolase